MHVLQGRARGRCLERLSQSHERLVSWVKAMMFVPSCECPHACMKSAPTSVGRAHRCHVAFVHADASLVKLPRGVGE